MKWNAGLVTIVGIFIGAILVEGFDLIAESSCTPEPSGTEVFLVVGCMFVGGMIAGHLFLDD